MKRSLAIALGVALAGGLGLAPSAFAAEDGSAGDASGECSDGEGSVPEGGDAVPGTLSIERAPHSDPAGGTIAGEIAVCLTQTDGNADGATRIGGDSTTGDVYVVADGDGDNREESRGYIGVEANTTDGTATPVSDGDNCNYDGAGAHTDPGGVVDFATGTRGDGQCTEGPAA